jgi:hypothetical protein
MVAILNTTREKVKTLRLPYRPRVAVYDGGCRQGGNNMRATAADAPIDGVVVIV